MNWGAETPGTIQGYNVYRSTTPFTSIAQGTLLTLSPTAVAQYTDLPPGDGTYYYLITAVSLAGLESGVSQSQTSPSDRTLPEATSIVYTPQNLQAYDADAGEIAPGLVNVTVTMSEPLKVTPFFSVTPAGGFPISVALQPSATSNLLYTGTLAIQATTPTGQATAVLSAIDLAGNHGTKIDSGGTLLLDTAGPAISALAFSPSTAIQNNPNNPSQLQATLTLNKPVKDGTTPVVGYFLSSNPANALTFTHIVAGANNTTWIATTTLPGTAGATTENLTLTFNAIDHLGNVSTSINVPDQLQVFQGNLPGLAAPFGLTAQPQPGGKIKLQWQSVASASNFQLYRQGPNDSSPQPLTLTGGALTYSDSTSADGTYTYAVASVRSLNGQSSTGMPSGPVSALAQSHPTQAPQNLAATLAGYGVILQWQAPANLNENITYSIYRSAHSITSLTGLTPIATGLTAIQAVDQNPNPTLANYAVVAVDAAGNLSSPSNSVFLDVSLLPVSSLTITQVDANSPVITWAAVPGNVAGYNFYLGLTGNPQQLNASLLTNTTYTDTGYTSNERQYTVVTVDNANHSSMSHSLNLPLITATLAPNSVIQKGLINDLVYTVVNNSAEAVNNIDVRVTIDGKSLASPSINLQPGQSQQVTVVVGGYSDLPTGTAPITTAVEVIPNPGELVSIQRSGLVSVINNALVASVLPSNFTRGGYGNVQFSLTNPSPEPIQVIVAQNNGTQPSSQVRFVLVDGNNTVYSTTPVQFNVGANVITHSDGNTVLQVSAGGTITSAVQKIAVPEGTPDSIYVQLGIDQVYFDEGQPDQVVLQGLTTRQPMTVVSTSYFGTVTSVTPAVSNGNQPITINGTANYRANNSPAANQPLILHIDNAGFDLSYQVATDANGNFTYNFSPTAGGVYSTWAINPAVTDRNVQQTFTVKQISLTPNTFNLSAPKNYPQTLNFTVRAGSDTSATNLHLIYSAADQPGGVFPTGVSVNASGNIASLGQNSSATLPVTLAGDNTSGSGSIVLRLHSDNDQGQPWQTAQINYTFASAVAALSWTNYSFTSGINPGGNSTVNLTLQNQGLAAANNITFQVLNEDGTPAPSWVSLGVASTVSQLNVGSTTPVAVNFNPPANQAQGDYSFIVRASAPNQANQDAQVGLAVNSSGMGNALFHVTDIYTGTTDSSGNVIQGLAGATVMVTNINVPSINATLTSDANGDVNFQNLAVGEYQYHASASGHDSSDGTLFIQPGATSTQQIGLQNDLVSVNWQVVPTTIQDQYNVTLNVTFQTNVPAPVITVEPGVINLPQLNAGDIYNGQVTFTNHGLIAANNLSFNLPANDGYLQYQLQGTVPSSLAPGQTVTLPYRITCIQTFPGASTQLAMLGGGGATMLASVGLLVFGWSGRRRIYRVGLVTFLAGATLISIALPMRVHAQTTNCFKYQTGTALQGNYQCLNGTFYNVNVPVEFTYIYNQCAAQTVNYGSSAATYSQTVAANGSGGGGGTLVTPTATASSGPPCFPKAPCHNCGTKAGTQSYISLTDREYQDNVMDLQVKVPGGTASVTRYFYGNAWHWRGLNEGLTLTQGAGGIVSIIYENDTFSVVDAAFTTYVQAVTQAKIVASASGYRLQTKDGEWKTYDLTGKLLATGYRNLTLTTVEHDSSGNLTGLADANGRTIFTVQATAGQISSINDWGGRTVSYGYTGNNLTSVKDAAGQAETYAYDGSGHLKSKSDVNGNTFNITYDPYGDVTSETDAKGNGWFFTFSYDAGQQQYSSEEKTSAGKVEDKVFASDGTMISDTINGVPQQTIIRSNNNWSITEANGAIVQQSFDEFNNLTQEVRPEGTTAYAYEPAYNQPTQITYADGTVTSMAYDANGNLTSKTEASGTPVARTTRDTYDAENELTEKTDARGNKTDYTYDANGNLVREFDPANPAMQITYTYDAVGNRLTRTDGLNHTTTYTYDGLGRVVTETDPLGNEMLTTYAGTLVEQVETGRTSGQAGRVTEYSYDQQGRRTQVLRTAVSGAGANGAGSEQVQSTTTYDGDGNVVAEANALGQATTYAYDAQGRQVSATQPYGSSGATKTTAYDAAGNVVAETDATGVETTYTYDQSNRVSVKTEAVGTPQQRSTGYHYDGLNRVVSVSYSDGTKTLTTNYGYDALGRRTSVSGDREYAKTDTYDENDNLVSETDGNGQTTRYTYDAYNRRTAVQAPGGLGTTSFSYDLNGNLTRVTDGNGAVRRYTYDADNRQLTQSVPNGTTALQTSTYDAWGEVTGMTDAAGGTTSAVYDGLGRAISRTVATGLTTTYQYNGLDEVTLITYPAGAGASKGSTMTYLYDSVNGQLLAGTIDRAGNTTTYQYDARFLKTGETEGNGATTQYLYDGLGRLVMQTDALGNATLWSYDQFDQVTEQALPDSTPEVPRVATYTYDNYGKLISQAGTGQYPVTYTYDGAGNQVSLTNGNGSKTQWSYDGLNRVTGKTYSDGSRYGYHYDQAGNLTQRTDAKGQTTQYAYNAYNLVSQISYPTNAPVQFTYDTLGRRTGMSDSTGTVHWNWNGAGENIGYSQTNVNTSIQYSYNSEAQRTQMAVGVSSATPTWTTSYTYDAAGRLNGILDNKISTTNPFSYAYAPNTNWIAGHSNADGSAVLNQYDVLGRLTSISAANGSKAAINTYAYSYDAAGQRSQEASTVGTRNFSYDDQRQLTSAYRIDGNNNPIPSYDYNYNFDAIGNWTKLISPAGETDITSNGLNQYIKFMGSAIPTPQTPTYDLNGNMITDGKGNTYVYDEENRLIEADTPNTTITKVISVYDGLSRRVEKRTYDSSGTLLATTRYLYDGLLPIAEYDASNNVTKTYTRGLDLSGTLQGAGGIGGLLAVTDSTCSYSYFTDGNGNITDLTNAYGNVVSHQEYDPFGNVVATTGSYQQSYGWSSKETDVNGLVYYLYRFYDAGLGRWVNRDQIEEKGGINMYEFTINSPLSEYDDWGSNGKNFNRPSPGNPNSPQAASEVDDALSQYITPYFDDLPTHDTDERVYGPDHPWTEAMEDHQGVQEAKAKIKSQIAQKCGKQGNMGQVSFSDSAPFSLNNKGIVFNVWWLGADIAGFLTDGILGHPKPYWFGSFNINYTVVASCCQHKGHIDFVATDKITLSSMTRIPTQNFSLLNNNDSQQGIFRTIPLRWYWSEDITF